MRHMLFDQPTKIVRRTPRALLHRLLKRRGQLRVQIFQLREEKGQQHRIELQQQIRPLARIDTAVVPTGVLVKHR